MQSGTAHPSAAHLASPSLVPASSPTLVGPRRAASPDRGAVTSCPGPHPAPQETSPGAQAPPAAEGGRLAGFWPHVLPSGSGDVHVTFQLQHGHTRSEPRIHYCTMVVPAVPSAVRLARWETSSVLDRWGLARIVELSDTVLIILSELVTNSVRHATRSPVVDIVLSRDDRHLLIAVHDRDPRTPQPPTARPPTRPGTGGGGAAGEAREGALSERGRGLALVQELVACAHGHLAHPRDTDDLGKAVAVTLPLPG